jgi:hypothetical protein
VAAGDRVLYGQRVDGVVRVTDVPREAAGRAYLLERGLEEEGPNANAALQALIADYLRQASVLGVVPMSENLFSTPCLEDLGQRGPAVGSGGGGRCE